MLKGIRIVMCFSGLSWWVVVCFGRRCLKRLRVCCVGRGIGVCLCSMMSGRWGMRRVRLMRGGGGRGWGGCLGRRWLFMLLGMVERIMRWLLSLLVGWRGGGVSFVWRWGRWSVEDCIIFYCFWWWLDWCIFMIWFIW